MNKWTFVLIAICGMLLTAVGSVAAQTVVKDFVLIEGDPAWVFAPGRPAAVPSRLGEVITRPQSSRYQVAEIEFTGRRADTGLGPIAFPTRAADAGTGQIGFSGRSARMGMGGVDFTARPAPGVRGTERRVGTLDLPGIPLTKS